MILPELTFSLPLDELLEQSPLQNRLESSTNPSSVWLGRAFAEIWYEFNRQLSNTPIVKAIEEKTVTVEQYQSYLRNMRQQVSQGGRWITRAASSMENSHVLLRNALIKHAAEEHQDFRMLEQDYLSVGGDEASLYNRPMNIGSQALSAFIMHEASKPNPVGIFGATFIIEGLGSHKAAKWSQCLQDALNLNRDNVKFLYYHGVADVDHYDNLLKVLNSEFMTEQVVIEARRIAKIVGRLYALQLEELDNI